jgi:hypothetical protein
MTYGTIFIFGWVNYNLNDSIPTPVIMSETEQRISIAEACGWTHIHWNGGDSIPFGDNPNGNRNARSYDHLPDYTNDLNAIHDAEILNIRSIIGDKRYRAELIDVLVEKRAVESDISACAAHRCEALLRYLGKWK